MSDEEPFPSRTFLSYWRANAVSAFGSYITLLALQTLVVVTLHGSAAQVGWLNAARWLPYLVLGIVVGALVDRYARRPILVATDVAQAVLLSVIPLLWWLDRLTFPALLVIVIAFGTASLVNGAADMSFVPRLVPRAHLQRAHARIDGADAAAMTSGPALGGLLVSILGAPVAVLADAASYLYSAAVISRVAVTEAPARTGATATGLLREIREGIRWIYADSGLTTLAVATHAWFVGNAIVNVVLAPYVLRDLGLSPFQFGLVGALGGVGSLLGAAITTWVGLRLGTGRTIIAAHVLNMLGALVIAMAAATSQPWLALTVAALGWGIYGLALGMSNSHEMSYRQLMTPDEFQARTNTTLRSLNRAVIVVTAPLAGILADAWGIRPTLVLAALVFALVAAGLSATSFRTVRAPA